MFVNPNEVVVRDSRSHKDYCIYPSDVFELTKHHINYLAEEDDGLSATSSIASSKKTLDSENKSIIKNNLRHGLNSTNNNNSNDDQSIVTKKLDFSDDYDDNNSNNNKDSNRKENNRLNINNSHKRRRNITNEMDHNLSQAKVADRSHPMFSKPISPRENKLGLFRSNSASDITANRARENFKKMVTLRARRDKELEINQRMTQILALQSQNEESRMEEKKRRYLSIQRDNERERQNSLIQNRYKDGSQNYLFLCQNQQRHYRRYKQRTDHNTTNNNSNTNNNNRNNRNNQNNNQNEEAKENSDEIYFEKHNYDYSSNISRVREREFLNASERFINNPAKGAQLSDISKSIDDVNPRNVQNIPALLHSQRQRAKSSSNISNQTGSDITSTTKSGVFSYGATLSSSMRNFRVNHAKSMYLFETDDPSPTPSPEPSRVQVHFSSFTRKFQKSRKHNSNTSGDMDDAFPTTDDSEYYSEYYGFPNKMRNLYSNKYCEKKTMRKKTNDNGSDNDISDDESSIIESSDISAANDYLKQHYNHSNNSNSNNSNNNNNNNNNNTTNNNNNNNNNGTDNETGNENDGENEDENEDDSDHESEDTDATSDFTASGENTSSNKTSSRSYRRKISREAPAHLLQQLSNNYINKTYNNHNKSNKLRELCKNDNLNLFSSIDTSDDGKEDNGTIDSTNASSNISGSNTTNAKTAIHSNDGKSKFR